MKLPFQYLAVASLTLFSTVAMAHSGAFGGQPVDAPKFVLSAGFHFGGDDLATVEYDDGSDDDLEAGGGIYLGAGIEFPMAPNMALRTSVGYQFDSVSARNGDADFDRVPWDAMVLLGAAPHRLGFGLTYHTDVQYDFHDDLGRDVDADFDDALGLVLAYELELSPVFSISFKYTDIEYEEVPSLRGQRGKVIDGSNGAVTANLLF